MYFRGHQVKCHVLKNLCKSRQWTIEELNLAILSGLLEVPESYTKLSDIFI